MYVALAQREAHECTQGHTHGRAFRGLELVVHVHGTGEITQLGVRVHEEGEDFGRELVAVLLHAREDGDGERQVQLLGGEGVDEHLNGVGGGGRGGGGEEE